MYYILLKVNTYSEGAALKDLRESDWYASTVRKLVDMGGIGGYPDGTFKPNNQITKAEFTKMLVSAIGYNDLSKTGIHWASGYTDKAVELNLLSKSEMNNLDNSIPRKEMAKMVANSLDVLGEGHVTNRNDYKSQIKDFNNISSQYQDFILKAYTRGIITDYTDGTFGGDKGLTRAEATSVVIIVIDKTERKLPPTPTVTPITESGPNVDLNKVTVTSKALVSIYPVNNTKNGDFGVMFRTWEPLSPQHKDAENLLTARFGDNSSVKEIMDYIKIKDVRAKELKLKT